MESKDKELYKLLRGIIRDDIFVKAIMCLAMDSETVDNFLKLIKDGKLKEEKDFWDLFESFSNEL